MLEKNTITKIALGVAAAAFIFSVITLIRAIIIGTGVLFASIQVIGTLIIVSICGIMLYVLKNEDEEAEEPAEEENTESSDINPYDEPLTNDDPSPETTEPQNNDDRYDLENFE